MSRHYDIVIVGAGMVGAALACMLGGSRYRVAVIEAQRPKTRWPKDSVDLRVSAISAASQQIFMALDAWERMVALGVSPYYEMHVWDATGNGAIHFDCASVGEPWLGHIIENRVIQRALLERMKAFDNIELICPARITTIEDEAEQVCVRLEGEDAVGAALVVGADGGNSRVRQQAGIATRGWAYEQKAVVATVATRKSHQETAWQRFMPDGPLAFLPLRDGRSSIVWSTTPGHADELLALDDQAFCRALGEAFEYRLGEISGTGPRAAFPLRLQHSTRYIAPRRALVGDAAHMIHPLAGQGVNLGFLDAAALSEVLLDALAQDRPFHSQGVLRRYERWRKGDNLLTMSAMDGFKRLFGSPSLPLRLLRNTGLRLANIESPVKQGLIRQAMGLKGDLPRLARWTGI